MFDRRFARRFRRFAAALVLVTPSSSFAATAVHSVLLDTDASAATGCPVTTAKGMVRGVGQGPAWASSADQQEEA